MKVITVIFLIIFGPFAAAHVVASSSEEEKVSYSTDSFDVDVIKNKGLLRNSGVISLDIKDITWLIIENTNGLDDIVMLKYGKHDSVSDIDNKSAVIVSGKNRMQLRGC